VDPFFGFVETVCKHFRCRGTRPEVWIMCSAETTKQCSEVSEAGDDGAFQAWAAAMLDGDYERAWLLCDSYRLERVHRDRGFQVGLRHLQVVWDGTSLLGKKVLVRCYHGLGDTIQFMRFLPRLRELACHVVVWVQPQLLSIVRRAPGVDRVLALHDGIPDVNYDVDIEIMELAYALRITTRDLPGPMPYIAPSVRRVRRPHTGLAVGVVWQTGGWGCDRSLPYHLLAPLARANGIRLYSLQTGSAAADAVRIPAQAIGIEDTEETIQQLLQLDLLITVDTFIAHLAGALGCPAWVMLRGSCDWRWMRSRSDSPWYPTLRLFRQSEDGDWSSVISEILTALEADSTRLSASPAQPRS
jgi:hypothetical protein